MNTAAGIYLDEADSSNIEMQGNSSDPITYRAFITKLSIPQNNANYTFNVRWKGHFNSDSSPPEWLLPVKSWQDMGISGIDDNYGDRFGTRSIDKVQSNVDIVVYSYAFSIDPFGGVGAVQPPASNFALLSGEPESLQISVDSKNITDGATINVWVTAFDLYKEISHTIISKTFIDTNVSNLQILSSTLKKHSTNATPRRVLHHDDEYTTR